MHLGDRRLPARFCPHHARRVRAAIAVVFSLLLGTPVAAFAPRPVPGRLILQFGAGVDTRGFPAQAHEPPRTHVAALDALADRFAVRSLVPLFPGAAPNKAGTGADLSRFYVVEFPVGLDLATVRAAYAALPAVEAVDYDWMCPLALETNDSASQWYLESASGMDAHVTGGWNHSVGDTNVVLAIADSGVDWMHPDLGGTEPGYRDGNIRINWAEYNGMPGVDDDANGYVDDVRGWDFVSSFPGEVSWAGEDSAAADNDPSDFNGHGTHVAGIAGARTNNALGVAGVGFNCRILPLRIGGSIRDADGSEQGVVWMSYAAAAIQYATARGAAAINCSWGSSLTAALKAAVDVAIGQGVVVVVAAGNDNGNSVGSNYLASRGDCFDVAATTMSDTKASFSNFGPWVDIAAPGVNIISTYFDHNAIGAARHTYRILQGTSMAAPVVTGLVGLVKSHWPVLQRPTIQFLIQAGADDLDAIEPGYAGQLGSGRVNALRTFGDRFLTVPGDYPTVAKAVAASSPGDTVAMVGGATLSTPLLLSRRELYILGGWNPSFTARDTDNPTTIAVAGGGPAVEFASGVDSTLVLEGLRFTGGQARNLSAPSGRYGGGVLCIDASPVLRRCRLEGNTAGSDFEFGGGGGGFFLNSAARLVGCVFGGNQARQGGGLYVQASQLRLEDCTFEVNSVHATPDARGAGLYVAGGSVLLAGGRFAGNLQADLGGGIYAGEGASVDLRGVLFVGNQARSGGGLALDASTLALVSSVLHANGATQLGGGIYAVGSRGAIFNATFHSNGGAVGAISAQDAPEPWSVRNSIVSNHSGLGMLFFGGTAVLDYGLFWNNSAGDLSGATAGPHDLVVDPLFVDPDAGDLALGLHSPALDSGDPAAAYTDADGSPNDRGAFGGPAGRSRAPRSPAGLHAARASGINVLTWDPNPEVDVMFYAVYGGADSAFTPAAANFIGSAPADSLDFIDAAGAAGQWYRIAAVDSSAASSGFSAPAQARPTAIDGPPHPEAPPGPPARFALRPNQPNPFNPSTRIAFDLAYGTRVRLDILDAAGRLVRRLVDATLPAGTQFATWNGRDGQGAALPSGIYVVRMRAERWSGARKIALVR